MHSAAMPMTSSDLGSQSGVSRKVGAWSPNRQDERTRPANCQTKMAQKISATSSKKIEEMSFQRIERRACTNSTRWKAPLMWDTDRLRKAIATSM